MMTNRLLSGRTGFCLRSAAARTDSCTVSTVRHKYWWGHDTIEEQEARKHEGKAKDVITWSDPSKSLTEKQELSWVPARIRSEARLATTDQVTKFKAFKSTNEFFEWSSKFSPSLWNIMFKPERAMEEARKASYAHLVLSQEFMQERLLALGPDLAAAHFLCHANCRVRFRGHKDWTELNSKGELDIPATYVKGWYLEAIDACTAKLVYEGLQNLRNLHYLKYLDISYCDHIDEWCMDRISGEYADTLEYLNISGCRSMNSNGLEILWRFTNLKTLVIKDMDHVEHLPLVCLMLLDINPKLKIVGAEYMDLKLLENTKYEQLLSEDFIPKLTSGAKITPTSDEKQPQTTTATTAEEVEAPKEKMSTG